MQDMIEITLNFRVISKKNSKRRLMRGGRVYTVPSVAYEKFQTRAVEEIIKQVRPMAPLTEPLSIDTIFHIKGNYKVDADNLHTSILDVLMAAGVIADDGQVVSGSYKKVARADDWLTIITVKF